MTEVQKLEATIANLAAQLHGDERPTRDAHGRELPEAKQIRAERQGAKNSMREAQAKRDALLADAAAAELAALSLDDVLAEMGALREQVRSLRRRLKALAEARNAKVVEAEVAALDPAARERLKKALLK